MKVLMKKVGGYKKARIWNMAAFQTRRWHREQEALKDQSASSDSVVRENPADSMKPAPAEALSSAQQPLAHTNYPADFENQPRQTRRSHREQEALKHPPTAEPTIDLQPAAGDCPSCPPSTPPTSSAHSSAPGAHDDAAPVANGSSIPGVSMASPLSDLAGLAVRPSSRARVGKIARLPHNARETVNAMLRGGFRYKDISAHLESLGYPGITSNNVSFWKYHGYMDWLARQHELEARAHLVKSFEHCTRALDTDRVQQNAIGFAAEQLCQVMALYDHRNILNLLNARPELFPKFVESLATLSRCSNDLSKAFASNQQSDLSLRAEMKANPITGTLSEPVSDEDVDADLADMEEEEGEPASLSAVSQNPASLPTQPASVPKRDSGQRREAAGAIRRAMVPEPQSPASPSSSIEEEAGGGVAKVSPEIQSPLPVPGASSGSAASPFGNSRQIQACTTNGV